MPVIWDLDTRALVRHLRDVGALRGVVATDGTPAEQLIAEARALADDGWSGAGGARYDAAAYEWTKGSIDLAAPFSVAAAAGAAAGESAASGVGCVGDDCAAWWRGFWR